MPITWWKSGSSSPSSSSSSPRLSPSSPYPSTAPRNRDVAGLLFGRRDIQQPRLTRQRKLRHLSDIDVGVPRGGGGSSATGVSSDLVSGIGFEASAGPVRSSSSPALQAQPQPLPLPDYVASPQRENVVSFSAPARPLPSRKEAVFSRNEVEGSSTADVEPIGERISSASVLGSRFAYQSTPRSPEHVSSSAGSKYGKSFYDSNYYEPCNFRLNDPTKSAPTSGFSSPVRSPRKSPVDYFSSSYHPSQGVQTWSAPEMTLADVLVPSPEKVLASPDRSPFYSPRRKNPAMRSTNLSAPTSPLHPMLSAENSMGWHDNGHPLPLPPVPVAPLQPGFTNQASVIPEVNVMTNQWQKGKLIGSGTFGRVYLATNRHTGALCAMKEVNIIPDDPKSAECLKQLEQEIKFLSQLKHPNIVQYYGSEMIEDQFYIYLEYVYPGSIQNYVREHFGAMTESIVRNFTRHILSGLAYLHSKDTMHRDIKGANLLVDLQGVVKLADFGMAKHLSGATDALSLKGTPFWMAPEVVQATMNKEIGYDLAVDIWSLGCTIIEMFTGKHPWDGLEGAAAMFKVLHKDPPIPEALSPEGKDLLQKCFRRNPADRPTARALLEHPFIRNSNHYNLHGSIQSFAGIKLTDNTYSPRDRPGSKSEPSMRGKQFTNGEMSHSHPETSESGAIRLSPRSTLEAVPSTMSPPHFYHPISSASPSVNTFSSMYLATSGHRHPHVLPKPLG